jgi:uncharacterized OsmC-like protein
MPKVTFSIKAEAETHTKTIVKARNFEMIIDEPKNLGGTDSGANPAEYLIGALSGCLNVVGHLVAKEMNIALSGLEIDIEGNLDPAKFMGKDTTERAGYCCITVNMRPETDASEEQLQNWIKAVEERCPVSDNIQNATSVTLVLDNSHKRGVSI